MNGGPLTELRLSDASGEEPACIGHVLPPKDKEKPPPLRSILTRPVIISISSYGMLALLVKAAVALIPLVWSTPVELGGLGLSPASIGLWISGFGWMNGIFQYVCFSPLMSRFGPRSVFLTSVLTCALIYALFPFENLALRHASSGSKVAEKLFIILQLSSLGIGEMGFSKSILFSGPVCAPALTKHESIRRRKHVRCFCRSQQAIARRDQWPRADGGVDPTHDWTRHS